MNSPVDAPFQEAGRKRPAQGVHIDLNQPTIVFLTVCTRDRTEWLNQEAVQLRLREVWRGADAWLVGHYLLMPDHIHLFCAPRDLDFTLESWVKDWKSQLSKAHNNPAWQFQPMAFHHRLRRQESYTEKWNYVQMNPVRRGLVKRPEHWRFQGVLNVLPW